MGTSRLHGGRRGPSHDPVLVCREGRERGNGSWAPLGAPIVGSVPCGMGCGLYGPLARMHDGMSSSEQVGVSRDHI